MTVSGFHTPHLSLDDHTSPNSTSPSIINQSSLSVFSQWVEYLNRGLDGYQRKKSHFKCSIAADNATNRRTLPTSQLIAHDPIRPTVPVRNDDGVDGCNKQKARFTIQKWMGSLQKRPRQCPTEAHDHRILPWVWALDAEAHSSKSIYAAHQESASHSSFRFVSAVRSTSTSITGSRTDTNLSQCPSRVDLETEPFKLPNRSFHDDKTTSVPKQMDRASIERSIQRRKILHELIYTEKSYLGDIRFLLDVRTTCRPEQSHELMSFKGLRHYAGFAAFFILWTSKICQSESLRDSATPRRTSE